MPAKEFDKTEPDELARVVAENALRAAELQTRVTQLHSAEQVFELLCPERFPVSLLGDTLDESFDESEEVTPLIITGGQIQEVKIQDTESRPRPEAV